ncbi:S1C family serine protease [Zhouia sp. PK063]|uniref:S1C family serine protease n=1 Tax=Zhouia sp. PK063 TaxID=3373602 RepID=UPI0037AD37D3
MKKILSLLFVSMLGGALTLGAYIFFFEKTPMVIEQRENQPDYFTTSLNTTAAGLSKDAVDFTTAAAKTVHSVVHVKNVSISSGPSNIFDFMYGSGAQPRAQVGVGSGVIISPDGYIVTNNHVIKNASELEVTLNDNEKYKAKVIGSDPTTDIALIKIDAKEKLPALAFANSDNTQVGQWVLAVGNPFNLTSTVTAGIVSAKARDLGNRQSFIQTDAAVNPGNSGGALVDTNGDLIGINTAITSQTGSYVGYAFAVPSNVAKKVVQDIMEFGNVQKGLLGVGIIDPHSQYAVENNINPVNGVYVGSVEEGSGAEKAGIETGDIIKKVDNINVSKFADLTGYLTTKRPNDKVQIVLDRDGSEITKTVTLLKKQTFDMTQLGISVKDLSDSDKKAFKTSKGVKIVNGPSYSNYNLNGKILLQINDEPINDINKAKEIYNNLDPNERNMMVIMNKNGEKERFLF